MRIAFSIVVLAYLGFLGFISVLMLLPGNFLSAMGHFSFINTGDTHNLVHELVFAFIVGTAAVGLLSQLWKPRENFAGQLTALSAWVVMIMLAALTNNWVPQPLFIIFGGLTLAATILHPAGRGLFSWIRNATINKTLLALVIVAAVPLIVFALININLQIAGGGSAGFFHNPPAFHDGQPLSEAVHDNEHAIEGHYRNLAAFSFLVILAGLVTSLRPRGFRFAAWITGLLPVLLGLSSVILPNAESSLGLAWSLAVIVWGVIFITAAEFTKNTI